MNNFLANLTAKNLEQLEVLQPRLPSLFESWPTRVKWREPNPEESLIFSAERQPPEERLTQEDAEVREAFSTGIKPHNNKSGNGNAEVTARLFNNDSKIRPPTLGAENTQIYPEVSIKTQGISPSSASTQLSLNNQTASPKQLKPERHQVQFQQNQTLHDLGRAQTLPNSPLLPITESQDLQRKVAKPLQPQPKSHSAPSVSGRINSFQDTSDLNALSNEDQKINLDSPPSINITIGRIEIRATTQPLSQSRPKPASPQTMSLDDYLKQRSGGTS